MRSGIRQASLALYAVGLCAVLPLAISSTAIADEQAPENVTMLLKRNAIPAIFDPTFVSAREATIPVDAWVLGVVIEGKAHAYSLNLLNHHEIVNDEIAGRAIAAVW